MPHIKNYRDHVGTQSTKFYKDTLFEGDHLMVGINCLEPGQVQPVHDHADQDKVYLVMEGRGLFTVRQEVREAGPGEVVWAAAGVPHGVKNKSDARLESLLYCTLPSIRRVLNRYMGDSNSSCAPNSASNTIVW